MYGSADTKTVILSDEYDFEDGLVFGWLVVINTDKKGKIYSVNDTKSTVGRGDIDHIVDIDIHNDRTISRGAQAIIVYDHLNKQIVMTYQEIMPYDIIQLGTTQLLFVPLCSEKFSW